MLENVQGRVRRSQAVMYLLWERAKELVTYRFQDVWFVIGKQGAMAQVNETAVKVKARILIIAPKLSDIDPVPIVNILESKKHVAIRIATHIVDTPECNEILSLFAGFETLQLRDYTEENLWGVSRENEEVFVGGVSALGDVAGIASTAPGHQKMFIPILEDAWLKGKKVVITRPKKQLERKVEEIEEVKPEPVIEITNIDEIFKELPNLINNGDLPIILTQLKKAKELISEQFQWHPVLYEVGTWVDRLNKSKETKITEDYGKRLLNKLEDWESRLKK